MILNFGSINIDHVYRLDRMPQPGETLTATAYDRFLGGKGVNQSVAAKMAGGEVFHLGAVGSDGGWALAQIAAFDLATGQIKQSTAPTGNAVIYVDAKGENEIVILGGANQDLDAEYVSKMLEGHASEGDWVILQNEVNDPVSIAQAARAAGCKIAYSAAPFIAKDALAMLDHIDLLAVNEYEAAQLSEAIGKPLAEAGLPMVLMTYGSKGATLHVGADAIHQSAFPVEAVDTTGAGDVFVGSLIARLDQGDTPENAMRYAAGAGALQVTKAGATAAIPAQADVYSFLKAQS